MERKNDEAAASADLSKPQADSSGEIDLYNALTAFAELPAEEQQRLVDRSEAKSTEPEKAPAENAAERAFAEPALAGPVVIQPPVEGGDMQASSAETTREPVEEVDEKASPEPAWIHSQIKEVEARTTSGESTTAFSEESEPASAETIGANAPIESVEPAVPESESNVRESNAFVEPPAARSEVFVRPSGPLGSLTFGYVFTGALSRGVCLACGAESGADDLFCLTCGAFIDEISSTLPLKPTCAECKQEISTEEIFCPWCGSVLPAA